MLHFAVERIERNINEPAKCNTKPNTHKWDGVYYCHTFTGLLLAEQLLVTGTDVNRRYDDNMTALHIATERDFLEAAKYLIQHGADLEARMRWRFTPLHYAAFKDSPKVAEELIRSGANVNATGNAWTGETILQRAAERGSFRVSELLIRSGADVNSKDR